MEDKLEKDIIYIHYGHDTFRPELIYGPHNRKCRNKPKNALWASPEDSEYSWKRWCESEDFHLETFDESFRFKLKDGAKVLYVDSNEMAAVLPKIQDGLMDSTIDFDHIKSIGYDAVEVVLSKCWDLYWDLYGWDCDSIAILNPDVVEVIFE